jgi:long-chain fatty acid transport protein
MKRFRTLFPLVLACAALAPAPARAAGYAIYEQGAAVLGMAGAGTASVSDASALFYNPATLTRGTGSNLYVGGSVLMPTVSFAGTPEYPGYGVTEEMKSQLFKLPTLYLTHRYASRWAVGVGFNAPFGLGVDWKDPNTFTGRTIVTKGFLGTGNVSLSAAYEINPQWSVAAGGDALFATVELQNRIQAIVPGGGGAVTDVAKADLKGDLSPGYGWNGAVSFVPNAQWKLGATYRSKVVVDEDGAATPASTRRSPRACRRIRT